MSLGGACAGSQPVAQGPEYWDWMLLCSDGDDTPTTSEWIVRCYEARRGIEEFFRLLKSGTRIEDRQLQDPASLESCRAFDAITAWHVHHLGRLAREEPETPAGEVLEPL